MTISATIQATCVISTTPLLRYIAGRDGITSTATITTSCTHTSPYRIGRATDTESLPATTIIARFADGAAPSATPSSLPQNRQTTASPNTGHPAAKGAAAGAGNAFSVTVYGVVEPVHLTTQSWRKNLLTATVNF